MPSVEANIEELCTRLSRCGQPDLAKYLSGITPPGSQQALAEQIAAIDLDGLSSLIEKYVKDYKAPPAAAQIKPAPCYQLDGCGPSGKWDRSVYLEQGESLLRDGKIGCFTVAGGQGSRLGYDGPKGCFPTSCVSGKPLFQIFAESIAKNQQKYGCVIPWYIMTSPLNHEATVSFFEEHQFFGLDSGQVMFFSQGVMPSLDAKSGSILLRDPIHLATNPDGHGGSFRALQVSGALDDMHSRGIEHISYFQVDNPHAQVVDPVFLGLHAFAPDSSGEFSSKMVAKSSWDEKVGVFCEVDGRIEVIEYSDLDESLAKQLGQGGTLAFNAGSIAIHAIGVRCIDRLVSGQSELLPFHRALKRVPHFDPKTGRYIEPSENNAVKLEKFVFDAIPIADQSIVVETDRVEEFAPVKNATGNDSIESSKRIQSERAGRWLRANGVSVPIDSDGMVDATIEITPTSAVCADDLRGLDLPEQIEPGSCVVI